MRYTSLPDDSAQSETDAAPSGQNSLSLVQYQEVLVMKSLLRIVQLGTLLFAAASGAVAAPKGHRIALGPKRVRVVVFGVLTDRAGHRNYVLRGVRGERIALRLRNLTKDGVVATYHITFPSGKQYGLKGYDPFDGRLTENGDYQITVGTNSMASNGPIGRYALDIRLLKRGSTVGRR